jgi:hypothetical protein
MRIHALENERNTRCASASATHTQETAVRAPALIVKKKVALITLALGDSFGQAAIDWFESSARHFCADGSYQVYHLVLTNHLTSPMFMGNHTSVPRLFVWPNVKKRGWPADTLSKFANLVEASEDKWISAATGKTAALPFSSFDFVLMTDADQIFVRDACEDLLGRRIALAHPQYWDRSFLSRNYAHKCQTFYPMDNEEKG